ncbi:Aldehyde dehydrogenase family protein, partial [Azotobacter beijerinckii]
PGGGEVRETFFYPAVLYPVSAEMRVYQEEQFGPLVPVVPYRDLQTVIDYVRESDFGQQLSIFGNDPKQVGQLVDAFANQVGRININAQCQRGPDSFPFNGRKNSAEGTLSVYDALRVFSIRTLVATKFQDDNKQLISEIIRNRESSFLTTDYIF